MRSGELILHFLFFHFPLFPFEEALTLSLSALPIQSHRAPLLLRMDGLVADQRPRRAPLPLYGD